LLSGTVELASIVAMKDNLSVLTSMAGLLILTYTHLKIFKGIALDFDMWWCTLGHVNGRSSKSRRSTEMLSNSMEQAMAWLMAQSLA